MLYINKWYKNMKFRFIALYLFMTISPAVYALDSSAEEYHQLSLGLGDNTSQLAAETGYVVENILPAIDLTYGFGFSYLSHPDPYFGSSFSIGLPVSVGMMFSVSSINVKPYVRAQYDVLQSSLGYDVGAYYTRDTEILGIMLMQRSYSVDDLFSGSTTKGVTLIGISYGLMW